MQKTLSATGTGNRLQGRYSYHPARHSRQLRHRAVCQLSLAHSEKLKTHGQLQTTDATAPKHPCPFGTLLEPAGSLHGRMRGSPSPSHGLRRSGATGGGAEKGRRWAPPPRARPRGGPAQRGRGREQRRGTRNGASGCRRRPRPTGSAATPVGGHRPRRRLPVARQHGGARTRPPLVCSGDSGEALPNAGKLS